MRNLAQERGTRFGLIDRQLAPGHLWLVSMPALTSVEPPSQQKLGRRAILNEGETMIALDSFLLKLCGI